MSYTYLTLIGYWAFLKGPSKHLRKIGNRE